MSTSARSAKPTLPFQPPDMPYFDVRQAAVLTVALLMLALLLLPCVVTLAQTLHFDVDPRLDTVAAGRGWLGPGAVAWLQVVSVGVAGLALGISVWAGARLSYVGCALAAVGVLAGLYHLTAHFDNQLVVGGWIAGVSLGLAALHLAQHDIARRWIIAGLLAMLLPMAIDAIFFALVDQPRTLAYFLDHQADILRARGAEPGSAAHLQFERRLRIDGAAGPFSFSNVFASIAGSGALLAIGVAFSLLAQRRTRLLALLPTMLALLGLVTVWLARSRGATVGVLLGILLLALGAWAMRSRAVARQLPAVGVTLVVLALAAVVLRGLGGAPPSPGDDPTTTLLFRYHYLEAGTRIAASDLPGSALLGVGPAQFHDDYPWAKNPANPEHVRSIHNVFADYIVMLGLGGWAWSLLLLAWLWNAGRRAHLTMHPADAALDADADAVLHAQAADPARDAAPLLSLASLGLAAAPGALVFGFDYVLNIASFGPEQAVRWLVSVIGFIVITAALAGMMRRASSRAAGLASSWWLVGLFAAAGMLLVHNQIEMSFYQFNATSLCWTLLGLAAGAGMMPTARTALADRGGLRGRLTWLLPAGALAVLALLLAGQHARPMTRYAEHMAQAAAALRQQAYPQALRRLDLAGQVMPTDATALRWRVDLRREAVQSFAQAGRTREADAMLAQAMDVLDDAAATGTNAPRIDQLRARVHITAADHLGRPADRQQAIEAMTRVTEQMPYSLRDHLQLADLQWHADPRSAAEAVYRRVLVINEMLFLDPAAQLSESELQRIEQRLATMEALPAP